MSATPFTLSPPCNLASVLGCVCAQVMPRKCVRHGARKSKMTFVHCLLQLAKEWKKPISFYNFSSKAMIVCSYLSRLDLSFTKEKMTLCKYVLNAQPLLAVRFNLKKIKIYD